MISKDILKTVLADAREEVTQYKVIPREFQFEEYGNYVLTGIRRAGKSFLLYQHMQKLLKSGTGWDQILYINFEDERLIGMVASDLNSLLEIHLELYGKKPVLFLDEIQNVEGWEKFARRLADTGHKVYITGSNARMLSKDIQTTLGGRFVSIEVYPYSFKEFLIANGVSYHKKMHMSTEAKARLMRQFEDYFFFGGFPEGVHFTVKRNYLTSIYQKVFLGDIIARNTISNSFALRVMFYKIAESVGRPLSFNRIANIVTATGAKVTTNTIINYIEYAKDAWLLLSIQNIEGKLVNKETNPKYYFLDNGLLNLFLLDGNTALLENLVAVNLIRKYGREDAVFYYHKNHEVDFYVPEASLAIQVCYKLDSSLNTYNREVDSLIKITKVLDCKKLVIVTKDQEQTLEVDGRTIEVIPIWRWLTA
ncbi:MAG TPA: ATP-binding protein [Bacteroidales bacterium]|jgi:hypothetical protein|nr:ATP-binding protein [Bacteroidales bacterium]HQK71293.1 ATP-binding protein [Bacteroidales bacterium]HQM58566.1 ATP-binding protein [Bacteroidales bacterium]HQM99158.1 ATP-binding protein [Bacteroidales bacterium]HQQ81343.1 ATP-binding protein [Bacteroidales bacterium]